jgi:hypothetical protein
MCIWNRQVTRTESEFESLGLVVVMLLGPAGEKGLVAMEYRDSIVKNGQSE